MTHPLVLAVFALVYAGMMLGGIPGLAIDRTGVALLGAIALVAFGGVDTEAAWRSVDVPTMGLLFGLMVLSAQLRLGGFYSAVTSRIASASVSPEKLLAAVVAVAGGLSAVLANDIVCLAMTPILLEGTARRGLDPRPFLLALAAAANVGSAATLIGNPQNMLIGQTLRLSFAGYLLDAAIPALLGLAVVWGVLVLDLRRRDPWRREPPVVPHHPVDRWQTTKGLLTVAALVACFLVAPWPREALALAAAGIVLLSRQVRTRSMLGLVDWPLLVLFTGLFVVNHALAATGMLDRTLGDLRTAGVDVTRPAWLFAITVPLSNLVSNVPAVMLLLPAAVHPVSGPALALASTLAGNLLIVGSIANIIVVEQAGMLGVRIGWREHARVGIPITVVTLLIAAAWLGVR